MLSQSDIAFHKMLFSMRNSSAQHKKHNQFLNLQSKRPRMVILGNENRTWIRFVLYAVSYSIRPKNGWLMLLVPIWMIPKNSSRDQFRTSWSGYIGDVRDNGHSVRIYDNKHSCNIKMLSCLSKFMDLTGGILGHSGHNLQFIL